MKLSPTLERPLWLKRGGCIERGTERLGRGLLPYLDERSWGPEPGQQGKRKLGFRGETVRTT